MNLKKVIYLKKIGDIDHIILTKLQKDLEKQLKKFIDSVEVLTNIFPLDNSEFRVERNQYDGTTLLKRFEQHIKNKNYPNTLGVLNRDIFSLNKSNEPTRYVFGIARKIKNLDSTRVALISIIRLKEDFYDRRRKKRKERKRILKEAVHELGHTFSLEHCKNYCVMQYSNSLAEADEKPAKLCQVCSEKLENIFENYA